MVSNREERRANLELNELLPALAQRISDAAVRL